MIHRRLRDELDHAASRVRRLHLWQMLAVSWLSLTALGLAALAWQTWTQQGIGPVAGILTVLSVLATALAIGTALRGDRSRLEVARRIERTYPELSSCLLAAIEQRPDPDTGRFGYLQSSVIRQAVEHAKRHPWTRVVPAARMRWAALRAIGSLALLAMVTGALATVDFPVVALADSAESDRPSVLPDFRFTVEPGNTEVERGTSLLVLARIMGEVPADAALFWKADGEETRLAMSRSLNDPIFGGRIPSVIEPLEYRVETNGQRSETFRVTVFEYPRLERADARLVYPGYAGLAERTIEDVRVLSVPEGTMLTLICRLNKPVATASLQEEKSEPIALSAVEGEAPVWQATFECDRTRQLKLELADDAGRKNQGLTTFKINVVPNRPVTLKPTFPARDLEASPLEELDVMATAWDDYGVKRYGVSYALAGRDAVEVVLGEEAAARQKHELRQQIRLEDLRASPDELLSYHWWAEDLGNDGQPRRVESDMYFAEVRRFEEIFREGEQPAGGQQQQQQQSGQGPNAQQAEELAKLQKDIINATWKVIRREIGATLSDQFAEDVGQIAESQRTAMEQAEELAERIQDPESLGYVDDVLTAMKSAIQELETSRQDASRPPLTAALKQEQQAYQALLKLRAREHRVVRQQRQSGMASSSRSQQQQRQMAELDLNDQQNPYEAQRLAQSQQQDTPEDRENRQVLNRLRELARRQNDLNERLKELQASLDEARSEEQKEEIRRQLKRLQEEQQQILQDTDELQARMDQPENQERMSEERNQLEQAREQARRSSEALEQEQVTQAAATGTRAQREFEELRNEFRRRTSGQFSEEMRQMRDAARELDTRQQQLSQEMGAEPQPVDATQPKSLADETQNHDRTAEELAEQRQRLAEIQEQMRRTIENSETAEPLLAERLYEAARGIQEQNLDRALQAAESSLRRGLLGDARQQEQAAGRGVTQLREGIERAAESVLGDEAEALRRAREELERLSRELNNEIARNRPTVEPSDQSGDGERTSARNEGTSGSQPGEPQEGAEPQSGAQPSASEGERSQQPEAHPGENPGEQRSASEGDQRESRSPQENPMPGDQQPGDTSSQESASPSGQPPQDGQQPEDGQSGQAGPQGRQRQPGQEESSQPGEQRGQGDSPQAGEQPGPSDERSDQQTGQRRPGQERTGQNDRRTQDDPSGLGGTGPWTSDNEQREYAPLTGADFLRWSDRLRDVEEIVEDPELRAEAARIRERARAIRGEFRRHSRPPEWDLVQEQLSVPLMRLRDRVSEELLRRTSREAIVPLDRDPVPPAYSEKTRRYYERLGTGR